MVCKQRPDCVSVWARALNKNGILVLSCCWQALLSAENCKEATRRESQSQGVQRRGEAWQRGERWIGADAHRGERRLPKAALEPTSHLFHFIVSNWNTRLERFEPEMMRKLSAVWNAQGPFFNLSPRNFMVKTVWLQKWPVIIALIPVNVATSPTQRQPSIEFCFWFGGREALPASYWPLATGKLPLPATDWPTLVAAATAATGGALRQLLGSSSGQSQALILLLRPLLLQTQVVPPIQVHSTTARYKIHQHTTLFNICTENITLSFVSPSRLRACEVALASVSCVSCIDLSVVALVALCWGFSSLPECLVIVADNWLFHPFYPHWKAN